MVYINTRDKNQKNTWKHHTIDGEVVRQKLTDKEVDSLTDWHDTHDIKWTEEK